MTAMSHAKVPKMSRRALLGATGGAAAGALSSATAAHAAGRPHYPRIRVAAISKLRVNRPVSFAYPLKAQPSMLIDMGRAVPGGVGPKRSIVAYSLLCQHMGCPVEYRRATREFVCPCHQTQYDAERHGAIIQGVAMRPLPRVLLRVASGTVWAVGVEGLIYGYRSNLKPGRRVGAGS